MLDIGEPARYWRTVLHLTNTLDQTLSKADIVAHQAVIDRDVMVLHNYQWKILKNLTYHED